MSAATDMVALEDALRTISNEDMLNIEHSPVYCPICFEPYDDEKTARIDIITGTCSKCRLPIGLARLRRDIREAKSRQLDVLLAMRIRENPELAKELGYQEANTHLFMQALAEAEARHRLEIANYHGVDSD